MRRVLLALLLTVTNVLSQDFTVNLSQGKLTGVTFISSRHAVPYFGFRGIPYAQPPLGPLRFKAPKAAESWSGVRDGSKEGSKCVQHSFLTGEVDGSEDCLFLNVYTPRLPDTNNSLLMPVMVWIHGGGFTFGSGNKDEYGPDYLIEEDVVFVSLNYRLGPFGFLSLENADVPGNAGLKDQVMALRWIQSNIATFGGDPNCVTVFGQSAGGAAVHYLLLSPLSQGLFHRAIAESGSALAPWAYTSQPREMAFRLANLLGTNATHEDDLAHFLRNVPAEKLLEAASGNDLLSIQEKSNLWLMIPFAPTKEAVYENGEDIFLPGKPMELILQGKFQQVPFLTGICSHEGYLLYRILQNNNLQLEDVSVTELIPPTLRSNDDRENLKLAETIKNLYFGEKTISNETLQNFVKMTTDFYFEYPCFATVKSQSSLSTSQIFFYLFKYEGALNYKKQLLNYQDLPGAVHGEELGYLFAVNALRNTNIGADSEEFKFSMKLINMWTNFTKMGNPLPVGSDISWSPYAADLENYMEIDKSLSLKQQIDKDRMDFCQKLFQKPLGWPL